MVLHLDEGEEWTFEPSTWAEVKFASISPTDGATTFAVFVGDEEIDCVTTSVPHSWWPPSGQPFCPRLDRGDVLKLRTTGRCDVRLDLVEHE